MNQITMLTDGFFRQQLLGNFLLVIIDEWYWQIFSLLLLKYFWLLVGCRKFWFINEF